ncbi:MAG TPA: sigma-70 family RNA polymerase sigma factor [Muribaculum sp.]|jgi:RNA polymerase sigma-70 factor (ECF subfamily)|uniref:Sigma-70 family RNA polymerase sigma factor n=1 Tax=Heminiphilus faecis TaxID=2601703 RepID=A0ABV4CX38_9BACT|nr:sigma-70 family RNA polymerase sigma factor [Heminiphilus faecis]RLT77298.1 sigma-70 family RNA polymerase sigma factor [bacterium J10(2018)]HRF68283.1 sigma-70 family RNA polymerase sigma factor [Muribaculum sp.]
MPSIENKDSAFDSLISMHGSTISKVCYFYAIDTDDFNDLRQEALINLWRGLDRFRGEAEMSTWVYRICLNTCVSYFRSNKKRRLSVPVDECPQLIADDTDKSSMLKEMYNLINRLGPTDKALILMWLDNYDYETIAEVMGIPRNTVASRLRRIKERLVKYSNQ